MTAYYPGNINLSYGIRTDNVDFVVANDVNALYDEIKMIETTVGINPHIGSTWGVSSFNTSTTTWASVAARIQNIENGLYISYSRASALTSGGTIDCGGAI